MDYVKKYGELIKDKAGVKPERARSMIRLGLRAENARTKLLPNKEMPKAFRMLTHLAMESVLKALDHPEKSCWTNIFAPVEIMQCFGLQCVSMECLSSFMSGFKIEDYRLIMHRMRASLLHFVLIIRILSVVWIPVSCQRRLCQ